MNTEIFLYNSLTRRKEKFTPIQPDRVGIYVCGPTVYNHSHIGHGKSYVSFDVIVRFLRFVGYKVLYVQNITDVGHLTDNADEGDDKIENEAKKEKINPMEVVETFMRSYFDDMDRLGIRRPDISPRATGHIMEQIELAKRLVEKGYAYVADGNVYFNIAKFPEYGKLSGRKPEDLMAGARVDIRSEKKNPGDFAIWKKAEAGHIMRWPSPWGDGFPGWHLECSAMSMKYLGDTFDIHGGGIDNQFPHHECEIAQSEAASGKSFVRYWLHNNMVTSNGLKMSKSLGNFVTLKDAFKKHDPITLRFFILQSHYRSPLDYSDQSVEGAGKGLERLKNVLRQLRSIVDKSGTEIDFDNLPEEPVNLRRYFSEWLTAMSDDFNSPSAIAALFEMLKDVNSLLSSPNPMSKETACTIISFINKLAGEVLGIIPSEDQAGNRESIEPDLVNLLIQLRADARRNKNFKLADDIRSELQKIGVIIEDNKDGTAYRIVR
ncbi:MAG: cysteine--tRNA ligase [Bacteroidetes bacterium]|jgi:cysteinyl-tRNA synthetase|nr:cysteine--tRNA ligase [Bacteroidota bacterium]MCL5034178.1 cysteine--tRNA ligase [Bacteroidota bacterium]